MLVTLLKWQDKTPLLVPMFKHLSFGLVESTRTHVKAHMLTNLLGVMFNS